MTAHKHCNFLRSCLPKEPTFSAPQQDLLRRVNVIVKTEHRDSGAVNPITTSRRLQMAHAFVKAGSRWCLPVLVLWALTTYRAPAQVVPSLRLPVRFSAFATYTDAKPHWNYYDDRAVMGFTLGGIMQLPRLGGLEARGSILRYGGLSHQETALIGPRVAVHLFHMTPYGALLVGEGNSWWWTNPPNKHLPTPHLDEAHGFEWSLVAGLDVHIHKRLSLRIGEVSYSRLYTPLRNMTPVSASTGLVLRIH